MQPTDELDDLVRLLRNGGWNLRTPQEMADLIADKIDAALSHAAGQEVREETMVEIFPGLPKLPQWLFDYAGDISRYMQKHHPGQWAIDGIESRGYLAPPTTSAEVGRDGALSRGVPEGRDSSAGAQCGGFRTKHGEHFDILYQAFTYASATDAKRLDWLAHHGASMRSDCQMDGGGWFVIAPYHTGISSVDGRARFATARAAIDAAMEGDE